MHQGGWRRAVAVTGAVATVAALSLLTVTALGALDDDDRQIVGLGPDDPSTTTTGERAPRTRRATTTTTTAPEVLGDVTTRDPDPATTTTTASLPNASPTATTVAPSPTAPAPTTTVAPPPPTAPPTTVCRNSTDPSCGQHTWEPAPAPYEVEVVEVAVPRRVVLGEEITFTVEYVERGGADAFGACAAWVFEDPGIPNISSCTEHNPSCSRYGPHDPPAPQDDRIAVSRTVTFTEAGVQEVSVGGRTATHLADGCGNPYHATWMRTFEVEVVDPDA